MTELDLFGYETEGDANPTKAPRGKRNSHDIILKKSAILSIAVIEALIVLVQSGEQDAKSLLAIATANDKSVATYLRIRKLSNADKETITISWVKRDEN